MNKKETATLMAIIKTAYPEYYRNQTDLIDAVNLWAEMFTKDDATLIAKAVKKFIKTDSKGFPPKIGQISTLAAEIRKAEWEQRKREQDALPEPEIKIAPMPEETKERLRKMGWRG